ncbi:MAG: hypothetical protein TUN42_06670 [Dehalogenimonas sp.]
MECPINNPLALTFRPMTPGEEDQVCFLVKNCFDEFIAPGYSKDGIDEFFKYANPGSMRQRALENHFVFPCFRIGTLVTVPTT